MENYPKSENMYEPSKIAPLIRNPRIPPRQPMHVETFYESDTSPIPVVSKPIPYPESWDQPKKKKFKLPPLSSLLSNHHFAVLSVIFTLITLLITMAKILYSLLVK